MSGFSRPGKRLKRAEGSGDTKIEGRDLEDWIDEKEGTRIEKPWEKVRGQESLGGRNAKAGSLKEARLEFPNPGIRIQPPQLKKNFFSFEHDKFSFKTLP